MDDAFRVIHFFLEIQTSFPGGRTAIICYICLLYGLNGIIKKDSKAELDFLLCHLFRRPEFFVIKLYQQFHSHQLR